MPVIPHESIKVGQTYKIDKAGIITTELSPGLTRVISSYRDDPSKVYIRIDSSRPGNNYTMYDISVLDKNGNVVSTGILPPGQSNRLPFIAIIGEAELNKQKSERVRQVAVERGLPGTSEQGPLKDILEYAGLHEVRPRIAGRKKTRKHKKSKKTQKNTRR